MITLAKSLLAVIAFAIFILLVTALGFVLGFASFSLIVALICAASVCAGVGILLAVALAIEASVNRLYARCSSSLDDMAQPYGDVPKVGA
jgi:hypothetical protein